MLTVFALRKLGNSKLADCEGFFSLDSPNAEGLFEGDQSFTSHFNAVISFQKEFVASFSICDQRWNYRKCSADVSEAGEASEFARELSVRSGASGLAISCLLPCPPSEPPKMVSLDKPFMHHACGGAEKSWAAFCICFRLNSLPDQHSGLQVVIKNLFLLLFFPFEYQALIKNLYNCCYLKKKKNQTVKQTA